MLQIAAAAALLAGEQISSAMGLSFAVSVDPVSGQGTPAFSTFISILATLLFLSIDGHLTLIATVHQSYVSIAPGDGSMLFDQFWGLVMLGAPLLVQGL